MPKFESRARLKRQFAQKSFQQRQILFQIWRQLEKHDAKLIFERGGNVQEILRVVAYFFQSLEVCNALRRLEREAKSFRHLLFPVFQCAFLRQAVKGGVYLNRAQALGIEAQHVLCRNFFGIETSLPLFIAVTAGADVKIHSWKHSGMLKNLIAILFLATASVKASLPS